MMTNFVLHQLLPLFAALLLLYFIGLVVIEVRKERKRKEVFQEKARFPYRNTNYRPTINPNRTKPMLLHNNRKETIGRAVRKQVIFEKSTDESPRSIAAFLTIRVLKVIYHHN